MARLFFALWPAPGAREALVDWGAGLARRSGGRCVAVGRVHLTLAFLGDVPDDRIADAMAAGDTVNSLPIDLRFDCEGSFRGSRVAWAGMSEPPPALTSLARDLGDALRERGFGLETRAFAPHVTLVRGIERAIAPASAGPVEWTAKRFALVQSDLRAGRYVERGIWELERGPASEAPPGR